MKKYSKYTKKYINNGILFHFMTLDKKDQIILELLKENSKLTTSQISKKTAIPITTVHNHIKKLEKNEIISGYTIRLNYKKLGISMLAYILIRINYSLPNKKTINQKEIAKKIKSFYEVEEVNIMAGVTDILIKVRTKDIDQLNTFIIDKLRNVEGIDKTQTMISLLNII